MRRALTILLLSAALTGLQSAAQDYGQPEVTVSRDKVRDSDGRLYYSHVVLEKQTLYSIAKAYGVTVSLICDANKDLNLQTEGLRKNTILRIPVTGGPAERGDAASAREDGRRQDSGAGQSGERQTRKDGEAPETAGQTVHTVRWYESLEDIAGIYGVSPEEIAKANNLRNGKVKSRMKLVIPPAGLKESVSDIASAETPESGESTDAATVRERIGEGVSDFFDRISPRRRVSAMLLMPFNASGNPSGSCLDFYSGFLLGVRDLGEMGISTDLSVYDVVQGKIPVGYGDLATSDMVIGPISAGDLGSLLRIDGFPSTPVVSPLDHKAGNLTSGHSNFIQAPAPYEVQYEDMVDWIKADMNPGDKVIVFSEKGAASGEVTARFEMLLGNAGLKYDSYSYSILQGRSVSGDIASVMGNGVNRIIIASDSEAFVNDVVRNLNQLSFRKHEIVLYSSSRIRSFNTIDVENLHKLNLHVSLSYFIDYESEEVRRFLMEYRALYGTEPTQFSFQGYDIARFFISACAEYNRGWLGNLASMDRMELLQNDFLFAEEENGGFVNQGIRRAVYTSDYRIVRFR